MLGFNLGLLKIQNRLNYIFSKILIKKLCIKEKHFYWK